jgi:arabinose-5-phosphate isomerase
LVPFVHGRQAVTVGVSCESASLLGKACTQHITLPLKRELCPFNLAPVTSAAVFMLFADVVTVSLMQESGLHRDIYALNHPSGRIGKRLTLRVSDVMLSGEKVPSLVLFQKNK